LAQYIKLVDDGEPTRIALSEYLTEHVHIEGLGDVAGHAADGDRGSDRIFEADCVNPRRQVVDDVLGCQGLVPDRQIYSIGHDGDAVVV
jgi:hypothetical protein